jgi:integrase
MTENLGAVVDRFLAHKRTLGRKYLSEQAELRLLVCFAEAHHADRLDQLTAELLDEFVASRPRSRPRSFNHLLGVVRGLLDWAVTYELLQSSPLHTRRRRATTTRIPFVFDLAAARRLLDAAAALPDNERARQRGPTYRTIFALCYGLGLRAGETCGLRLGDVDPRRDLLVVRGGKFGKTRLVPHGRRIGELIAEQLARRRAGGALGDDAPLFSFDGCRCVHPGTASQVFHHLVTELDFTVPRVFRPRDCMISGTPLLSGVCCAGIATGWTLQAGCITWRRSSATSTLPPRRSTSRSHPGCWTRPTSDSKPSPNRHGRRRRDDLNTTLGSTAAVVFRRAPDHRQGSAPSLGAQLPRHDPAAADIRRSRQGLQDHPAINE